MPDERAQRMRNDQTPRQQHIRKLTAMIAEYRTTKSLCRKNDLRKAIKRLQKELRTYDFYTNRDGWIR